MVCGQAHPQNTLPKMTVNRMMKTTNVIMPNAKMKKSWGPKNLAKEDEFPFEHIQHDEGLTIHFQPGQCEEDDQVNDEARVLLL